MAEMVLKMILLKNTPANLVHWKSHTFSKSRVFSIKQYFQESLIFKALKFQKENHGIFQAAYEP